MGLGGLDVRHMCKCVSKAYKNFVSKQESFKNLLQNLSQYLTDALEKLQKLKIVLKELEPILKSENMAEPHKEYVKFIRSTLDSLMEKFGAHIKSNSSPFTKELLLQYTMKFHYLALELNYFFPKNEIDGDEVFGKAYAEVWWKRNFGSKLFVETNEFYQRFISEFPAIMCLETEFLKTIGFSSSDYVSKFDLDLFTRLFGDKEYLITVFKRLVKHPGYLENGTPTSSIDTLGQSRVQGSYIFRISTSKIGFWCISFVDENKRILHAICYDWSVYFSINYGFNQKIYTYPRGKECSDNFSDLCQLIVSHGQSFSPRLCEKCQARPSNTRMEPCEHVCCRTCYKNALSYPSADIVGKCFKCSQKILCCSPMVQKTKEPPVPSSSPRGFPTCQRADKRATGDSIDQSSRPGLAAAPRKVPSKQVCGFHTSKERFC